VAAGPVLGPILAPGLRVLFVGVNPSLRSAEVGHHFGRPGNRFWPTLHTAGFTPRRLRPDEDHELPLHGVGVTNLAFSRPDGKTGLQLDEVGGRPVWVLPNPSGLNAHYKPADFTRLYAEARAYADRLAGP
jgi:double-stranded uracil-DNA glycosylase